MMMMQVILQPPNWPKMLRLTVFCRVAFILVKKSADNLHVFELNLSMASPHAGTMIDSFDVSD